MTNLEFLYFIPKCELHLHIEGTLEPDLMFDLAKRNNIPIRYKSIDEIKKAYNYSDLQGFLNIYYESAKVLIHERDFYDLTWDYLVKAHERHVIHTEIFFDPQTHTNKGIKFETVITGIHKALTDAESKLGITSKIIMCFLRDLDEQSAFETLKQAGPFKNWIIGVGLDSAEVGNPPSKFVNVFKEAKTQGYLCVAHAGEEGPAAYVHEAIDLLKVDRIDHGNHSIDDEALVEKLPQNKIPLTMCPLSNLKLHVLEDLKDHPLKRMMDKGIVVTVNSDDPAYFGGYIDDNYAAIAEALNLSREDIITLAKNSVIASFMNDAEKKQALEGIDKFIAENIYE